MKIKQLREYLNTLPEVLDNFDIVYSEAKSIIKEGEAFWSRLDNPVHSIVIDQDHEELVMGTMESIDNVMKMVDESEAPEENSEVLPDGSYPCLWSGYNVEIKYEHKTYNLSTGDLGVGVKGMNIPSIAIVKDNKLVNVSANK